MSCLGVRITVVILAGLPASDALPELAGCGTVAEDVLDIIGVEGGGSCEACDTFEVLQAILGIRSALVVRRHSQSDI